MISTIILIASWWTTIGFALYLGSDYGKWKESKKHRPIFYQPKIELDTPNRRKVARFFTEQEKGTSAN